MSIFLRIALCVFTIGFNMATTIYVIVKFLDYFDKHDLDFLWLLTLITGLIFCGLTTTFIFIYFMAPIFN